METESLDWVTRGRLTLLLLAVTAMSTDGFVLIRTGIRQRRTTGLTREWRVDVRHGTRQHTARAKSPVLDDPAAGAALAITEALARARTWLAEKGAGR